MAQTNDHPFDDAWARRVSSGVAAGSRDALESLYRARYERLFRMVQARTRRDDAFTMDCVHDAWIRVARHLRATDTLEALDRWLARAAISAAIDRLRVDAARSRREAQTVDSPERADGEILQQMHDELRQLNESDRSVIDLRFRGGLSLEALASVLGIGAKAAEIRLRRAVRRLGERLTHRSGGSEVGHDR